MVSYHITVALMVFPIVFLRNVSENLSVCGNGTMELSRHKNSGLGKYQVI